MKGSLQDGGTRQQAAAGSGTVLAKSACGSSREICGNYIDDNCNGRTDEGCDATCVCSATQTCGGRCPPLVTTCTAEVCDGVDNDCDGAVDEGCCDASEERCDDGIDNNCNGLIDEGCGCGPEICDDIDNDCDGTVDEGCPPVLH